MIGDCIFCRIVTGDATSWKVHEDESTLAFLDIAPLTEFHTLVVPKRHFTSVFDIPRDELSALALGVKSVVDLLAQRIGITDLQIRNSSGPNAQQDVFHVHFHVIPRSKGDGLDATWSTHREWADRFATMIRRLSP